MAGIGPDPDEADMEEADADSNRMVALYDFDPSTISWPFKKQRPLALQTGRVIQVDYDDGSQWALGHPVGQPDMKGYFPKNYTVSVAEYQEMMTKWEASEEALGKAESLDSGFGDTYPVGDTTYASASGMSSGLPAMSSTDREMPPVDETMEVEDLGGDFGPGYPGPPDSEPPYRGAAPTAWDLTGDPGREMPNISRGSAAETTAPPDDIAAALEEVKRENRKARENPRLVPGGMQTDSRASTPPTAQMIRPERDYVRRHLPPELQGMYMHKLSELPQVVKKRAPWKKVGKPTKVMFTAEPRVRATTLRIAHEIEPSNFRMAINNGGAGRWTQMFRPGFNDIVNESFKVGCNACILSRHYLNDADEQEKFRRLHVRDTNGINWFDLQRRKDHVYYQRMDPPDFVDVLMEHPAAWGFPDVNTPKTSSADPGKPSTFKVNANQGEPFDPMHGWYCQASIDTDKEMEEVEFCYNVRIRAFPERTFQALALGKMPEWIQSLANMSPDAPSLEEGDDLFSEKESGQARRIGEIDTELLHEAGLLDGDKVFSQARELIAPKEGEAKVAVGPDMLAAKMCSYRLKGISAMRIFMRSRANPDNMKQTLITPKMIIDFAAQLGIKGKFGDYWYCYFALRYALAPDWEVVVRNDTRYYLHLPSDRIQSIHPMIKRFREHLDDALQNEFLFDVREVVSKIREFQLKCSECGVPDAVVWCMQCTDYFCAKCFFDAHQSDRGKKHWPMPYPGARYLDRSEVERFREHIPLLNVGFSNRRRFLATDNQSDKMGSRSGDTWLFFAADSFQDALAQTQKRHVHLRRMNPPRLGPGAEGYYYNFAHGVLTDEPSHIMMKSHEQKALALLQKCIRGAIVRRRIKKEQDAVVVIQKCKMMWDCQKIYGNNGRNAEVLRAWYRRWKAKQDREKLEMRVSHTQAAFRGNAARTLFRAKMKAMTRFQAAFRGLRGRRHIRVLAAAIITIQRFYRGHLYGRRPMHEMHTNAARIQGMVRGVAFREDRRKRIEAATQIQAHIRGLHKRKFVKGMRSSAAKIQRNWRRFQAQLDVKIILYERLDNIRQKRQDIIRKKKSDAAATIIQRNWRRYVDFQHVIFLRREKNDADKRIQTLLVAVFTATGSLRHHVHPWWRHLPAELQEVLEKIKGSLQRTIAMVPVSGKIANEEVGKRGLRVADASCLTYVQTTKEPDLASHLLLSVTRHLLSLVPQELFPATVKWACYAIAHKAVDLVSIGHIPKEEIAVGKEMAPHPGDTLSTLWEETALVKHHHDHVMTLPDESMPCTVLYGFGGQHRQVFLTAEVLITMRQALDTPSLSTDDHLKFQGLDAVAGSQLMEVLGSELDHRLNKDWPKTYGTVAALATQLATHITEIQPEVVVAKAPKKPPTKAAKKAAKEAAEAEKKRKQEELKAAAESKHKGPDVTLLDFESHTFGNLFIQSQCKTERKWSTVKDMTPELKDQNVWMRTRVHNSRKQGGKLCFLTLRKDLATVQAVVFGAEMAGFAGALPDESVVDVYGKVTLPKDPVTSCTQSEVEIAVEKLFCLARSQALPLQLADAGRPEPDYEKDPNLVKPGQDTCLNNRVIDLRTHANQGILRIQSGVGMLFREFLSGQGFVEIHTPKMISAASEGGADVFRVDYFEGNAYLAQSPQLYKQAALMTDLPKVFEVGPIFRSERSFTHRHMTEFTGLDMEMTFMEHYGEVLDVLDGMFNHIFTGLNKHFKSEIEAVRRQYPFEDLKWKHPCLRLTFKDAIALMKEKGPPILKARIAATSDAYTKGLIEKHLESVLAHDPLDDVGTEDEKLLGKIIHEEFGEDFYIIDKFPKAVRPFYTMPDPNDPTVANAYDFFLRGEEITSGAQRIHDPKMLWEKAAEIGVDLSPIQWYVDAFKYGAFPHAGAGIGLERVVMLFMALHNIRKSSMFPRDPKRLTP
mmetsp:Transcript_74642/g.140730  ORF Transcript_74642/g.140730 Transcript_74642/m.140730 type:complete len:1923 (-) Transcript_74642:183-5951(-)